MVGEALVIFFIPFELFLLVALYASRNRFLFAILNKQPVVCKKIRALPDLLAIDGIEIAFAQREIMNRIQQVRFSRAVVACKNVHTLAEVKLSRGVVFEIDDGKVLQVHSFQR